ncbi:MAG: pyrroloquinoline quinone biosynthesis peptide chaperone PqqD [Gammaproteobacteria bacterium]|nr:pyrroloquinoline quinone biosynthesis peptide chaperone PqqD [Gammaproteobacteria bacterium]
MPDDRVPCITSMFRLQWEQAQECHVLLYPEGMVKLSTSAGEILKRVDGQNSVAAIIGDLKSVFPETDLDDDVLKFLEQARDNGWINI